MSDATPGIGDNNPPPPVLSELVAPDVIATIIASELNREPMSADGTNIPSIRARDAALEAMCKRFLAKYPKVESVEADSIATEVLSTCQKFAGAAGRIETARKALKKPVWDASVAIDEAFAEYGTQLIVRSLKGPEKDQRRPPYTLAEQIVILVSAYKDDLDRQIRKRAQDEADRKADDARMAEALASKGSGTVTMEDAASAARAAEKHQVIASAPAAALTRGHGGDFGSTSRKRVRTFTITAPHLVPRSLCVPSDSLIRAAIGQADGPMPVIAGVEITDTTDITRR
jgi:hypothetical protein